MIIRASLSDADAMRNIAGNVTRHRIAKDLSCNDLARFTGSHPKNISRMEDGKHMPRAALLARIANVLGVDLNDLIYTPAKVCRVKGKQTAAERRAAAEANRERAWEAGVKRPAKRATKRSAKRPMKKKKVR